MLLQMVFEKLAKAAYARSGQVVPKTHQVASHLISVLRRHPQGKELLRTNPNVQQFILELEAAQPSIAGKQAIPCPQLEYPWEDAVTGSVLYPAVHLSLARRVGNPADRIAVDCLVFASVLERELATIVP
jgi:hypothetical protein